MPSAHFSHFPQDFVPYKFDYCYQFLTLHPTPNMLAIHKLIFIVTLYVRRLRYPMVRGAQNYVWKQSAQKTFGLKKEEVDREFMILHI